MTGPGGRVLTESSEPWEMREVTEEDLLVPFCRDRPFHQEPVLRGTGFVQSSAGGVCARCLARMPRGLYLALAEHNGWSH